MQVVATKIAVKFGSLTESPVTHEISYGTSLGQFLRENSINYSSAIRVNNEPAHLETILQHGDIITEINSVSGG